MVAIHDRSLTTYQKEIVKAVSKLVDDRGFTYKKAQNNHLKMTIDGVDKPFYTCATPSDCNAKKNFLATVKNKLREANRPLPIVTSTSPTTPQLPETCSHKKMVHKIIKNFRTMRAELMKIEEKMVLEEQSVACVVPYRQRIIAQAIQDGLKKQKEIGPFSAKVLRSVKQEISQHLDFILPGMGHYADLLKRHAQQNTTLLEQCTHLEQNVDQAIKQMAPSSRTKRADKALASKTTELETVAINANVNAAEPLEVNAPTEANAQPDADDVSEDTPTPAEHMVDQLLNISSAERISLFKTLQHQQAKTLLKEMQEAMALRYEADCQAVIQLIQQNGLSIQDIADRLALQAQ